MNKIIGIMGPNEPTEKNITDAFEIGKYMANKGYVVLTGGLMLAFKMKV